MEPIDILENLLQQYSPTSAEGPAVNLLAETMRQLGFAVTVDESGSVSGSLGGGPREIVLLGHIDTVPGEIPVRREGDLLYGRGAVDAKGPLACFTAAAALAGAHPGWRVTVIGATGEEGDSRGAKHIVSRHHPDFCVIGEPSGWDHVTLAYKGSAWVEYSVRRTLVHTAAQAESAAEAAVRFWNGFQDMKAIFNTDRERAFDQLTTSLREMHTESDGFYETARLSFNLRLPPGLSLPELESLISPCLDDGQMRLLDGIECYRADKNTPLVRAFLSAIRKEGGKPGFLVKTGTSDMNIVGPAWNCPILAYGPGDSSLDHTPEEHISVEEYQRGVRVMHEAIKQVMDNALPGNMTG